MLKKKMVGLVSALIFVLSMGVAQATESLVVGGNHNTWGGILLGYLGVVHNLDGTLKDNVVKQSNLNLSDISLADFTNDVGYLTAVNNFSGNYIDLVGKPALSPVATSGLYSDLLGTPVLATIATSGSYNDLTNKPAIPTNVSQLFNDANYLTSYTETDPTIDLAKLQSLVSGDFHNLGGVDAKLSEAEVDGYVANNGYLTGLPDSYSSTTNAIYLQPNKDGTARVRFFANTTGSPLITVYGYNSVLNSRPWIYAGMFDIGGTGDMRGVIGASGDYGANAATMEIQSPYQVRITGVDNTVPTANVRVAASSFIKFHPRTVAETDAAKYLIVDTVGQVQGANVELSTNAGDLVLNPAGNVQIKNGFTGNCGGMTSITVVNGIITACS